MGMTGCTGSGREASEDPLLGAVLHDTHEVIRRIGRGGMGAVYEARHVRLRQQRFAIKVLHAWLMAEEQIFTRFRREAELASSIGHPNIIYVVDFYQMEDGRPCIVMEYLEGEDLGATLRREKKLSPARVVPIITQAANALAAVHARGIVHRDLKPGNLFLLEGVEGPRQVKVLDFGISKILASANMGGALTADKSVLGTPQYMSPEQACGAVAEVDHLTDIFALGTITYRLLTGEYPFEASSLPGFVNAIIELPHKPITELEPGLGDGVGRVIDGALAKDKAARYQRVELFAQELASALGLSPPDQELDDEATCVDLSGEETWVDIADEPSSISLRKTRPYQVLPVPQRVAPERPAEPAHTTLAPAAGEEPRRRARRSSTGGAGRATLVMGGAGVLVGLSLVAIFVLLIRSGGPAQPAVALPASDVAPSRDMSAGGQRRDLSPDLSRPADAGPDMRPRSDTSPPPRPRPRPARPPARAPRHARPPATAVQPPTPAPRRRKQPKPEGFDEL